MISVSRKKLRAIVALIIFVAIIGAAAEWMVSRTLFNDAISQNALALVKQDPRVRQAMGAVNEAQIVRRTTYSPGGREIIIDEFVLAVKGGHNGGWVTVESSRGADGHLIKAVVKKIDAK